MHALLKLDVRPMQSFPSFLILLLLLLLLILLRLILIFLLFTPPHLYPTAKSPGGSRSAKRRRARSRAK